MKRLTIDETHCTNCRICELVCAARHQGVYNPVQSRIRKISFGIPEVTETIVCKQCVNAPCAQACPVEALAVSDEIVEYNEERCIGCQKCVKACPYNAMFFRKETRKVFKCNLCGEKEPKCMESCPKGVIGLHSDDPAENAKRSMDKMGIQPEDLRLKTE